MTEKNILVAYVTNSGSTEEVAKEIAAQLSQAGQKVVVCPLKEVTNLEIYDGVVIGAPMILGWHRDAEKFIKNNQALLSRKPLALFATAMSLTETDEKPPGGLSLALDPDLVTRPKNPKFLSIKERYTLVSNYLRPMIKTAPAVKPFSVAFFGGKLVLFQLKWWQALFVLLVVRAQPGDKRNWPFIKQWAVSLNSWMG